MATPNESTVVIDTNLLISAIIRGGTPYNLLRAWQQNKFVLATSQEILDEIEEVLSRESIYEKYQLNQNEIQQLIDGIKLNAKIVTLLELQKLPIHSRDPKDDKLLACALAADADYLITGDEDLLVLNGNSKLIKLRILPANQFLK